MLLAAAILLLLAAALAARVARDNARGPWPKAPPGPVPLLVIDSMAKKYGEVMRMSMGEQHIVFLSGLDSIRKYSVMEETTARPENPTLLEMYSDGRPLGMGIGLGGPRWKEQRRFAEKALGKLGAGKRGGKEH